MAVLRVEGLSSDSFFENWRAGKYMLHLEKQFDPRDPSIFLTCFLCIDRSPRCISACSMKGHEGQPRSHLRYHPSTSELEGAWLHFAASLGDAKK